MKALLLVLLFSFVQFAAPTQAGIDDEAFFRQFLYRVDQDLRDPEFPVIRGYYFAGSEFNYRVPYRPGEELIIRVFLFMKEDGSYFAEYRDFVQKIGEMYFFPRNCLLLKGRWSVPDRKLVLEREGKIIASGERHFNHGKHEMLIELLPGLNVTEVSGHKIAFSMVQQKDDPMKFPFCF